MTTHHPPRRKTKTVCGSCGQEDCWLGKHYCENYRTSGTKEVPIESKPVSEEIEKLIEQYCPSKNNSLNAGERCANCGCHFHIAETIIGGSMFCADDEWICSRECEEDLERHGCPWDKGSCYRECKHKDTPAKKIVMHLYKKEKELKEAKQAAEDERAACEVATRKWNEKEEECRRYREALEEACLFCSSYENVSNVRKWKQVLSLHKS